MEQLDQIKDSLGRAGQPTTFTPGMQELEKMIRRNPSIWLWSHRRWKHKRPVPEQ